MSVCQERNAHSIVIIIIFMEEALRNAKGLCDGDDGMISLHFCGAQSWLG